MLTTNKRQNPFFPVFADSFLRDGFLSDSDWSTSPAVNIAENKEGFRIEVAAPGLKKEDFRINLDKKVLTISSEKVANTETKEENGEKYYRREFSYSSFRRSFSLPEYADTDKIKATHVDGILQVFIPKRDEAKDKPARIVSIE